MTGKIDISPDQLATVQSILRAHLPGGTHTYAFGSRVTWTAKPFSDLDLALDGPAPIPANAMADLAEAFEDSDLPWRVDIIDLNTVSPEFRKIVEAQKVPADWVETTLGSTFDYVKEKRNGRLIASHEYISTDSMLGELGGVTFGASNPPSGPATKFQNGDILFSNIRTYFRKVWLSDRDGFCSNDVLVFRANPKKILSEFLYYVISDKRFTDYSVLTSKGAKMPRGDKQALKEYIIRIPPIAYQQQIVRVLKSLDDKIELNRRMNEVLEAMARALFRDWFVDFGPTRRQIEGATDPAAIMGHAFPAGDMPAEVGTGSASGISTTKPLNATTLAPLFPAKLGDDGLPEGWGKKPLDKIGDFLNGLALQKFPAHDGRPALPVIKIAELRNGVSAKTNRASAEIPEKYIIDNGDFIFSWSGTLMAKFWIGGAGALNQHLFKVTSESHPMWFVSEWVQAHLEEFRRIAASKAVTMGHIKRSHLSEAMCVCPSDDALIILGKVLDPLIAKQIASTQENQTLAALRDLLLPKLMSGDIRLKDAEFCL